jgi:hypothetical protein
METSFQFLIAPHMENFRRALAVVMLMKFLVELALALITILE